MREGELRGEISGRKIEDLILCLVRSAVPAQTHLVTYDQVQARKEKAVSFLRDVVGDDDRADEVEDEVVEDYADRKGLVIKNPQRRRTDMANGDTKADLQDAIDQAVQILSDAYTPESSREDLAGAVGDALHVLSGDGGDDDDTDDTDDDDDDVVANAADDAY